MNVSDGRVRRLLVPPRRRLIVWLVIAVVFVAAIALSRSFWLAFYLHCRYWRASLRQEAPFWERPESVRSHPALRQLPLFNRLLDDKAWATPAARQTLLDLRARHPHEVGVLDYYLGCWDFWNGNYDQAEVAFRQHGQPDDLLRLAAHRGDLEAVRRLMNDPAQRPETRARAWQEMAQLSDKNEAQSNANAYYLRALENWPADGTATLTDIQVWGVIKNRLGAGITIEQYTSSLKVLAARTQNQPLLREVMFELGKLQMLAGAGPKPEVKP